MTKKESLRRVGLFSYELLRTAWVVKSVLPDGVFYLAAHIFTQVEMNASFQGLLLVKNH